MSSSIDVAFVKDYEADVHEAYQRRGSKLRKTVRNRTGVVGATTTFQKVKKGVATTKARHGQITPMNVEHENAECTLVDYYAGDWSDKLDEAKTNIDERRVLVNAGAYALGRKTDELVINEMNQIGGGSVIPHGSSNIDLTKILQAMELLGNNDVFEEGRMWAIVPWKEWTVMLETIQQFADADFIGTDDLPFINGVEAKRWLGSIWMPHSGLEALTSGSVSRGFWYHEDSIGHASGADVHSDITWHGDRAAHFISNMMSQGACLIDERGVVAIESQRS